MEWRGASFYIFREEFGVPQGQKMPKNSEKLIDQLPAEELKKHTHRSSLFCQGFQSLSRKKKIRA